MDEDMFRLLLFSEQDGAGEEELISLGYLIRSNDTVSGRIKWIQS
jgi:hypothetical protein